MRHIIGLLTAMMLVAGCGKTPAGNIPASQPAAAQPATKEPATMGTPTVAAKTISATAEDSVTVALPEVNPLEVMGNIISAGSSTVYPLSEAMAERFTDEGYAGNMTIDSIGTGGGFERFCGAGETDIANASRPVTDDEKANCAKINRIPVEFRIGTDALAIVVNKNNTFLTNVTKDQLSKIFSADITNWNEVDPNWPAKPILRFSPGTDSGTFDYFVETIMAPAYGDNGKAKLLDAANLQLSEDDNVLVQGVEGDANTIGYFGYTYYRENEDRLNILSIEGIKPGEESVDNGTYPLARPLFIYSDATIMKEKPQVAAFIDYYLTYIDEEISNVGYFAASDAAMNAARQKYLDVMGQ